MSYATKRLIWIIICCIAVLSEYRVAGLSHQFLWWQLDSTWGAIVTVLHVLFIFVGVGLAIYYNAKDAERR